MTDNQTALPAWTTCNNCGGLISGVDPHSPYRHICACNHNKMIPIDKVKEISFKFSNEVSMIKSPKLSFGWYDARLKIWQEIEKEL
jgi:hypothetical protein